MKKIIKYNIEVSYILNGEEETRNVYYKAIDILNDEQQEEVVQNFINILKNFYLVNTILDTHIWEDGKYKEKIDLNKLKNFKVLACANQTTQLNKVKEKYHKILNEVDDELKCIKNRDDFISKTLDLLTKTINLLLLYKVSDIEFNKYIEKEKLKKVAEQVQDKKNKKK